MCVSLWRRLEALDQEESDDSARRLARRLALPSPGSS